MIDYLVIAFFAIFSFVIFIQDLKSREVLLWVYIVHALTALYLSQLGYIEVLVNLGIVAIHVLLCIVYVVFRKKNIESIWDMIGAGDILLWLSITFLFQPMQFPLVFLFSLIFSLLAHNVFKLLPIRYAGTVPLAGFQSIFVLFVFLVEYF